MLTPASAGIVSFLYMHPSNTQHCSTSPPLFAVPAGRKPTITFAPSSGTVQPNSSLALQVTFHPRVEAASNYNVACLVKRKPSRLMQNVKGEGYAVHNSLQMETADGQLVQLSPDEPNSIDFGQVRGILCSGSGCRFGVPRASLGPTCLAFCCALCDLNDGQTCAVLRPQTVSHMGGSVSQGVWPEMSPAPHPVPEAP